MINFSCPRCHHVMSVHESQGGGSFSCPSCGNVAVAPAAAAPASATVPQARIKGTSGLGVAALVLGLIAAVLALIPVVGLFGAVLAALGAIFGFAGLIGAAAGGRKGVGMPIAGLLVSLSAIAVAILITGVVIDSGLLR